MDRGEIEELLMCISTTSGYTNHDDRVVSCNEAGLIMDYIDKLETRNEKALDYINRLLKGLVEKNAKYDLTATLVTLQVILEKGDEYE